MNSHTPWRRTLGLVLLLGLLFSASIEAFQNDVQLEDYHAQFAERRQQFLKDMQQIAELCEQNSFLSDAERIRGRARQSELNSLAGNDLPLQILPVLPKNLPPIQREWRVKLAATEKKFSEDLYRLARFAIRNRQISFGYYLIQLVAFYNPDHKYAREMLGFVREGDEWVTPFVREMRHRKYVNDPKYGWLPTQHVVRYQNGERYHDGQWKTAEREQIDRSDFRQAWEIESEHFTIRTNYSLERGVELSRQLEGFYRFFMHEYAALFNTEQQMRELFSASVPNRQKHQINYYKNKDEFVSVLVTSHPNIGVANGFYWPKERTAYFFQVDDPDAAASNAETMYHEVTHQLLGESSLKQVDVGEEINFWVIEGFACYMESFRGQTAKEPVIGDPEHPRIYWARTKALEDGFYVPMRRFTAYGRREFMQVDSETLHAHYSQATGLCHFLLNYEDGRYRNGFLEYLSQIYTPDSRIRLSPRTLEQILEVPFESLDEQYLEYLKSLKAVNSPQG